MRAVLTIEFDHDSPRDATEFLRAVLASALDMDGYDAFEVEGRLDVNAEAES